MSLIVTRETVTAMMQTADALCKTAEAMTELARLTDFATVDIGNEVAVIACELNTLRFKIMGVGLKIEDRLNGGKRMTEPMPTPIHPIGGVQ